MRKEDSVIFEHDGGVMPSMTTSIDGMEYWIMSVFDAHVMLSTDVTIENKTILETWEMVCENDAYSLSVVFKIDAAAMNINAAGEVNHPIIAHVIDACMCLPVEVLLGGVDGDSVYRNMAVVDEVVDILRKQNIPVLIVPTEHNMSKRVVPSKQEVAELALCIVDGVDEMPSILKPYIISQVEEYTIAYMGYDHRTTDIVIESRQVMTNDLPSLKSKLNLGNRSIETEDGRKLYAMVIQDANGNVVGEI